MLVAVRELINAFYFYWSIGEGDRVDEVYKRKPNPLGRIRGAYVIIIFSLTLVKIGLLG